MLSTVQIIASGDLGTEDMELHVGDSLVKTFRSVPTSPQTFQYTSNQNIEPSDIRIYFTNDRWEPSQGVDANLFVDAIIVDGQRIETEDPTTFSTGSWLPADGVTPGNRESEYLNSNGYFQFSNDSASWTGGGDPGAIALDSNAYTVAEDGGSIKIRLNRTGGSEGRVTVDYRTFSTTAETTTDFVGRSGTAVFSDGQTTRQIEIDLVDDNIAESDETFGFTIDNPGGATLLAPRTAQVLIRDNDQSVTDGLIAHWNFEDRLINRFTLDQSGNNNDGKAITPGGGPTILDGGPVLGETNDSSFGFDGNDFIRVKSSDSLRLKETNSFTQSVWVRPNPSGSDGERGVLGWENPRFADGSRNYPAIWVVDGIGLKIGFGDVNNFNTITVNDAGITPGEWNHIAVTYNGNAYRAFVNDQQVISTTQFAGSNIAGIRRVDIGRVDTYFNGRIDEVRIHNEALSRAEISSLYFDQQTEPEPEQPFVVTTETVVSDNTGALGGAISFAYGPADNLYIVDFGGKVFVHRNGQLLDTPFIDLSDQVNAVKGMLDITFHPDFENNPYVYLPISYDPPEVFNNTGLAGPDGRGNRALRLLRITADASTNYTTAVPGSEVVILGKNSVWENFNAFVDSTNDINEPEGGVDENGNFIEDFIAADSETHLMNEVTFGPDGALYVSIGDGASYNVVDVRTQRALSIDSLSGKILRIDPITGEGLPDNPFYDPNNPNANRSKVYQYGFRNPFRFDFQPGTNDIFVGDVGWYQWEEINAGAAGANFGWPFYEGNGPTVQYRDIQQAKDYYATNPDVVKPIVAINHLTDGIDALILGDFYNGDAYPDQFKGDLFFSYFGSGQIKYVNFDNTGEVDEINDFYDGNGLYIHMETGPDGHIHYLDMATRTINRWVVTPVEV